MFRSIGLSLMDTSSKDFKNHLEHDTDFHFFGMLIYILCLFPLKNDQTSHKAQSVFYMDDHDKYGSRKRFL